MAESLNIDVDLGNGYTEHLLNGELDATHYIMGDLGHAQPIFEGDVDFDDDLIVNDTHLNALVALFWRQKYCLPVMEAWSGDANNTVAFAGGLNGNGMDGVRQNFDLAEGAGAVRRLDCGCFCHVHNEFPSFPGRPPGSPLLYYDAYYARSAYIVALAYAVILAYAVALSTIFSRT